MMPVSKIAMAALAGLMLTGAAFSIVTANEEAGDEDKVTICHYPPGNPDNAHTIEIGAPAWEAHEAHGDTEGPCPDDVEASHDHDGDVDGADDETDAHDDEEEGSDEGSDDSGDDTQGDSGDDTQGDSGDDTQGDSGDDTQGDSGDDTQGDSGDDTQGESGESSDEEQGSEEEEDDGFGTQPVPPCNVCEHHEADVGINKEVKVTESNESHDDRVDYRLRVESVGNINATNVTLYDELPDFGGTWVLGGNDAEDCTLEDDIVECSFGDLAPGEERSVVLSSALCEIGCGDPVVNVATVAADNDADESNNEDSAVVEREPCEEPEPEPEPADLAVEKTGEVTSANGTDVITYDVTVSSVANGTATNSTLVDELPELDTTWNVTGEHADACTLENNTVTCDYGELESNETRSIQIVSEPFELGCGDDVVNTAYVTSDNDTNAENDESMHTIEREPCADAAVSKDVYVNETDSHGEDTVQYTFLVEAIGEADSINVTLYDELPDFGGAEYTLSGADADACSLDGYTLTCDFGDIASGESREVIATSGLCEIGCGEDIENTVTIESDNDSDASNNESTAIVEREDCPEA